MPIALFQNRNESDLLLIVEPWGERHAIPHLATGGIRYSLKADARGRCYTAVSDGEVEFWCGADSYEFEIVYPSAFDRLAWDICVGGGWCGGIIDGAPTTIDDLLPGAGRIAAEEFAKLVLRADGDGERMDDKALKWLEAKFVEHMGATSVSADVICRNVVLPFDGVDC